MCLLLVGAHSEECVCMKDNVGEKSISLLYKSNVIISFKFSKMKLRPG